MNSAVRRVALAWAALVLLVGCAGSPSGGSTTPRSSSPSATATTAPSPTPTPTGAGSASPDPSAEQCPDESLTVQVTAGDGGAGSIYRQIVFLNSGAFACSLHGSPGVSVVGRGDGTQLGEPAEGGGEDGPLVRLAPGGTAIAQLRSVNIGGDGGPLGDACPTEPADGWRIFPPHSFEAVFVPAEGLTACTGTRPWMSVGVVEAP